MCGMRQWNCCVVWFWKEDPGAQPSKCLCKAFESTECFEALGKKRTLGAPVSLDARKMCCKAHYAYGILPSWKALIILRTVWSGSM